jgi:hypothetical protein
LIFAEDTSSNTYINYIRYIDQLIKISRWTWIDLDETIVVWILGKNNSTHGYQLAQDKHFVTLPTGLVRLQGGKWDE